MKIMLYGENWQGTLPNLLYTELSNRNFPVKILDFTDILPGIRVRSFYSRLKRRVLNPFYKKKIKRKFKEEIEKFDPEVIIIAKGLHLDKSFLLSIRSEKKLLVNWNPDDFFNLKNSNKSLINAISSYDLIVSPRKHLFDKYYQFGASKCFFLDWYYVPSLHYDRNLPIDIHVSFVGSWSPTRESFLGKVREKVCIWGAGWEKSSGEFKKKHEVNKKILSQIEMSEVFNRSKFNINLLTEENEDLSNLRFFEVVASGGLLLTPRNESSLSYLNDKTECLMFDNVEELNSFLNRKDDFKSMIELASKRIRDNENSFSSRVDELLREIIH